jgi:hypothetical protein
MPLEVASTLPRVAPRIQNTLVAENQLKVILPGYLFPDGRDRVEITKCDGNGTFNSSGYNLVETSAGMEASVSTDKLDVPAFDRAPRK